MDKKLVIDKLRSYALSRCLYAAKIVHISEMAKFAGHNFFLLIDGRTRRAIMAIRVIRTIGTIRAI